MSRAHYVLKENGGGHAGALVRELHADETVDIRLIRVFVELVGRLQDAETAHGKLEAELSAVTGRMRDLVELAETQGKMHDNLQKDHEEHTAALWCEVRELQNKEARRAPVHVQLVTEEPPRKVPALELVAELLTQVEGLLPSEGQLEANASARLLRARQDSLEQLQYHLMRAKSEADTLRDLLKAGDR